MNIDKMDLLETFVRITELDSISKAAEDIDIGQSTTTSKLQKLEELIVVQL